MDIEKLEYCDECGSDLSFHDSGTIKKVKWFSLKCVSCGTIFSDEPDEELL